MKQILTLSMLTLLASLPLAHGIPTLVSYDLINCVEWHDDFNLISFNITGTIHMEAFFDCTTEGQTCQITANKHNETFSINYQVKVYTQQDEGIITVPTPQLLGDTAPYTIPLGTTGATLSIIAHSHILGTPKPELGTATPSTLTWTNWTTKNTNLSQPNTLLTLNTTYSFYMTISFGYMGVEPFPTNSTSVEAQGVPSVEWIIPEYPSVALVFLACASILLLRVSIPKAHGRPKSKNQPCSHDAKAHSTV